MNNGGGTPILTEESPSSSAGSFLCLSDQKLVETRRKCKQRALCNSGQLTLFLEPSHIFPKFWIPIKMCSINPWVKLKELAEPHQIIRSTCFHVTCVINPIKKKPHALGTPTPREVKCWRKGVARMTARQRTSSGGTVKERLSSVLFSFSFLFLATLECSAMAVGVNWSVEIGYQSFNGVNILHVHAVRRQRAHQTWAGNDI